MSNFITKNLIQCNLSELNLKSKGGFTFGGLTGNPYITINANTISANVNNTIDLTSTTINLRTISGALTYIQNDTQLLNINSNGFIIGDGRIKDDSGNIIFNAANNKKAYYVKNDAVPTNDDEIATKGDLASIDLDNYVLKSDFNQLLNAYNDLTDRLNAFLEATGNIGPEPEPLPTLTDEFITVPTDSVTFNFDVSGSLYLDWGDGNTDTITSSNASITHNYSEEKVWTIKVGPNDNESTALLYDNVDEEDTDRTDSNQFTEINLNDIDYGINMYDYESSEGKNTTLTIYRVNCKNAQYYGCGWPILTGCENLQEVYLGPDIESVDQGFENDCPNLEKLYLDVTSEFIVTHFLVLEQIKELYCYSNIPFDLINDYHTGEPEQNYIRFAEMAAVEAGQPIDVSDLTIYVPNEAVDTYKAAPGWNIYSDCIVGY